MGPDLLNGGELGMGVSDRIGFVIEAKLTSDLNLAKISSSLSNCQWWTRVMASEWSSDVSK